MRETNKLSLTRTINVEYRQEIPDELLPAIKEHVEASLHFLPRWCCLLIVKWNLGESFTLSVTTSVSNRWIKLYVHPGFFEDSPEERQVAIYHEFLHAYLEPMVDVFEVVLGESEKATRDIIRKWWNDALERSAEDLARRFQEERTGVS